jgi:hypothetical protein
MDECKSVDWEWKSVYDRITELAVFYHIFGGLDGLGTQKDWFWGLKVAESDGSRQANRSLEKAAQK